MVTDATSGPGRCGTMNPVPHVVAAPDKFRGTASARQIADVVARAAEAAGWTCDVVPVADGGEGILDVLGGRPYQARVHNPLGQLIDAEWRLDGSTAIV